MNAVRTLLLPFAAGLLSSTALAQTPSKPPPWWGVHDEVTVSLYWSFDGATPLIPTPVAVPTWYSPTVTVMAPGPNVVQIGGPLGGHVGLLGVVGNGVPQAGALDLQVDNDPHLNWVKIFWFQFDAFEGTGDITREIEQDLSKYGRAIVSETSEPIGSGWERVTIQAQLIPQPNDEGIDWSFLSNGGTVAIDNLYVSSKCVKPGPDETGDALGAVSNVIPLPGFAGNGRGAAVTQGPAPTFTKSYWVAQKAAGVGLQHSLHELSSAGPIATVLLGATAATVPQGPGDLAVETRTNAAGVVTQQIVWAILDARQATGQLRLVGVDAATTATSIQILAFPPTTVVPAQTPLGLAFDPSGELGLGTFWVASTDFGGVGTMREFSRNPLTPGALLDTQPLPPGCEGLGYDDSLGSFWGFSRTLEQSPSGPVHVNGFEISGYDFARTGVRFCGNRQLLNGGPPNPRGGFAAGFDVYRDRGTTRSQLNMVCLVDTPTDPTTPQYLYELAGPFGFGYSQFGRCGMRNVGPFNGVPFLGSSMEVTLTGVPDALFALMFLGFSNTSHLGTPLPLSLAFAGMPESSMSISPAFSTALMPPAAPGEFRMAVPIPPGLTPYTPVFFQWVVLHPNVPGFLAATQAGKTVLYP